MGPGIYLPIPAYPTPSRSQTFSMPPCLPMKEPMMMSKQKKHIPVDPEEREKGIAENERAGAKAFDKPQQYDDSDDDSSIRETNDPDEVDREGGDIAGTASGNLDDEEVG